MFDCAVPPSPQGMATTPGPRYGDQEGSVGEDNVSLDDKGSPLGDETFTDPPVAEIRQPKDPRSSPYHKYNIFSRLFFL